jgi:phosphoribosylanthranilate isomerase
MRVRIKICGLTRLEDVQEAVTAGADAAGFIFAPGSPRQISLEQAAGLCRGVPPLVSRIGVFVDADAGFIRSAVAACGLHAVQLHGAENPEFCRTDFGAAVIKAWRVRDRTSLETLRHFDTHAWLLDTYVPGQAGGTGVCCDWALAAQATAWGRPVILAGGLTPANVGDAIRQARPFAVDVSSGVESAPGLKDPAKVRALVRAVRRVEEELAHE